MNQLLKLLEYAHFWPCKPVLFITTLDALASKLKERGRVYVIGECNRHHPFRAIGVFVRCFLIASKERPDVVVTTGSMPLALFCIFAKLFGAKIIWIDSVANMEQLSMSGRLMRNFADLCLTQWPEVAQKYKNVEYVGEIL